MSKIIGVTVGTPTSPDKIREIVGGGGSGGGVTEEQIAAAVESYLEKNPVEVPEVDLSGYAKKEDIPSLDGYAKTADIPSALPNPNALTFTGAVSASYDGSKPMTVEIPQGGGNVKPIAKTEDMRQPVGVDENGQLWTAPTAEAETEKTDILLGTLPMTISESNCYLLSQTDATISTGEGAEQLLDFAKLSVKNENSAYSGAYVEVMDGNTIKIGWEDVTKNATVYARGFPTVAGKKYTMFGVIKDNNFSLTPSAPWIRAMNGNAALGQVSLSKANTLLYKTFEGPGNEIYFMISLPKTSDTTTEHCCVISLHIFEGELTELPEGATFDISPNTKYNTDGYVGCTLSAVNGETVEVYQTNMSDAENETDNSGVIFFGDSILDSSDVTTRYATKTGKAVLDCAVGGTRMSGSRESTNDYYPYDMANIASAIASGDFSAQTGGGKNGNFTVLASGNIANYKAIVLEFGTNDFTAKVPFDGDDVTSIKGALRHILTSILTKYPNIRIVVLSTLQYVAVGSGNESGVPKHDNGTVWQMNEVIKSVCESDEFCVPFVDMYHAMGENAITRSTLTHDGVHLMNPAGCRRYADILTAKLNGLGI